MIRRYDDNAAMTRNRLREWRKKRGLSQVQLAARADIDPSYVQRIESGSRGLSLPLAEQLAKILEVSVPELLGLSTDEGQPRHGFAEDVEAYTPKPNEVVSLPKGRRNIEDFVVKTNALDALGIMPGDIVTMDLNADAVEPLKPLAIVIAQVYDPNELTKATTVLRQFVPPALLITNSLRTNEKPLNIGIDDVAVKGVLVSSRRNFHT